MRLVISSASDARLYPCSHPCLCKSYAYAVYRILETSSCMQRVDEGSHSQNVACFVYRSLHLGLLNNRMIRCPVRLFSPEDSQGERARKNWDERAGRPEERERKTEREGGVLWMSYIFGPSHPDRERKPREKNAHGWGGECYSTFAC